jgi:hypothetical protein
MADGKRKQPVNVYFPARARCRLNISPLLCCRLFRNPAGDILASPAESKTVILTGAAMEGERVRVRRYRYSQSTKKRSRRPGRARVWLSKALASGYTYLASLGLLAITVMVFVASYPWLSIEEDFSFRSGNPYSTSFLLKNESWVPVTHLSVFCTLANQHEVAHFQHRDFDTYLSYKERSTVPCFRDISRAREMLRQNSSLTVQLSYGFFGTRRTHRTQTFRFLSVQSLDGSYHWIYKVR